MKCSNCGHWNSVPVNKILLEQGSPETKVKVLIPMYEPLEVFKCEKCRRIVAEPSELVRIIKERTTMEKKQCKDLLRVLESKVKEARTNPSIQSKEYFIPDFEMLYEERCRLSLNKFREEHGKSSNLFEKRLAKIAEDYLRRL